MSHEGIRFATKEQQERENAENKPLPRIAMTPEKVRVLLSEGKGLEIDWADGHKSSWTFAWLREACPCATCIDQRKQEGRKAGQPKAKARCRAAHVYASRQAQKRTARWSLRSAVQLAGRPLRRNLLMGVSAPRVPVRRVHL